MSEKNPAARRVKRRRSIRIATEKINLARLPVSIQMVKEALRNMALSALNQKDTIERGGTARKEKSHLVFI